MSNHHPEGGWPWQRLFLAELEEAWGPSPRDRLPLGLADGVGEPECDSDSFQLEFVQLTGDYPHLYTVIVLRRLDEQG